MMSRIPQWLVSMLTAQMALKSPVTETPMANIMESYDFIVIGGGTSGSIVANRLSEENGWNILLLEAGSQENVVTETPMLARENWKTFMDWNITTVKQKKACQAMGGVCPMPQGKVAGGSSSINMMTYVRGNRMDYDAWNDLGNMGWNYDSVLKYFKKAENALESDLSGSEYHGTGGPVAVSYSPFMTPLQKAYLEAGSEMGYKQVDYNGPEQIGFARPQFTTEKGMRVNSAKAYLRPLKDRKNVHILLDATVTKILFNKDKTIKGVEFEHDGQKKTVMTKKEVVLAAGPVNSAKLLMLSGVGPADQLKKLGIPLIHDSRVGMTMRDRVFVPLFLKAKDDAGAIRKADIESEAAVKELMEGKGPLSSPLGVEAVGFVRLDGRPEGVPDMEILVSSYADWMGDANRIVVWSSKLRPDSVGTIRLASANSMDNPLVNPRYLEDGSDYDDAVAGCMMAMRFAMSNAMKPFIEGRDDSMAPECKKADEKEVCKCLATRYSHPMNTPISANMMAHPKQAAKSVVCPRLRVHGVKGLRLVDQSIMPTPVSGDPYAPTIMIGEIGADFIKEQWKS